MFFFFFFHSVRRHGEQAEHAVGPGAAVSHSQEVLRELRGRDGEPGDYKHRPQPGPHVPQGKRRILISVKRKKK